MSKTNKNFRPDPVGAEIEIPANVNEAVTACWPELAPAWLKKAPDELARICERYEGRPVRTFNARYGFVVEIATTHGRLVVRSTPDPRGMDQAQVAQALANMGVGPRIHDVVQTPVSVWTVASRIFPGDSLKGEAVPVERLAPIFRKMLDRRTENDRLPTLVDWLRSRLNDERPNDLPSGRFRASRPERLRAAAILEKLGTGDSNMVCHGDASSSNILVGDGEELFLVDPRGVSGDVCYDVAVAAWKTPTDEQASVRATNLARLVGVDTERVRAWLIIAKAARV
ncbi:aminoglycoside phosphotransferase family protein [Actinomadura luteofluorescens]|uniref:aminoglycoside phosphotransferase family protein n=1 Tax=Actinomadura luteofluorescens TaxID=46163 RepID=UPI0030D15201